MKFFIKEYDKIQLDQILKAAKIMDDYVLIRREISEGKVSVNGETQLKARFLVQVGDKVSYKNSHIKVMSYQEKRVIEKEPEGNVKHGKQQKWLMHQSTDMRALQNDALQLAKNLQEILLLKKKKIAFAESCTGGLLQEIVTFHPGASAYFSGGVVCYSDELKEKLLKISPAMLKEHGAVSKETSELMVRNVQDICSADIGISITGIAGPDGGTHEKPVGTVYFSIGSKAQIENYHFQLNGNRQMIRLQIAINVLKKLISFVKRSNF